MVNSPLNTEPIEPNDYHLVPLHISYQQSMKLLKKPSGTPPCDREQIGARASKQQTNQPRNPTIPDQSTQPAKNHARTRLDSTNRSQSRSNLGGEEEEEVGGEIDGRVPRLPDWSWTRGRRKGRGGDAWVGVGLFFFGSWKGQRAAACVARFLWWWSLETAMAAAAAAWGPRKQRAFASAVRALRGSGVWTASPFCGLVSFFFTWKNTILWFSGCSTMTKHVVGLNNVQV